MVSFAKSILIAILAVVLLILLLNLAFFFPYYLTIVEAAFEVSQSVATDNYLSNKNLDAIKGVLDDKPLFNEHREKLEILVTLSENNEVNIFNLDNGDSLIEKDDYPLDWYYNLNESFKPYVQRGALVDISIKASYPIQIPFMGQNWNLGFIPATFTMTTTTLRLCKDLEYEGYLDFSDSEDYPGGGGGDDSEDNLHEFEVNIPEANIITENLTTPGGPEYYDESEEGW